MRLLRLASVTAAAVLINPATYAGPIHCQVPQYHIVKRLLADTGVAYLAVDADRRRLYGTGDLIFDIDRDSVVGRLPFDIGHGYAIANDLDKGITRHGVIFDLNSFKVYDTGVNTPGVAVSYDRTTQRAFVFRYDTVIVIDVASDRKLGILTLGGTATSAIADGQGHIFVAISADSIFRLNARSLTVDFRSALDNDCHWPAGVAIDRTRMRLFVSCIGNTLLVVDAQRGTAIAKVPLDGYAHQIAFDQSIDVVFVPSGHGTMAAIQHRSSDDTYSQTATIPTAEGTDGAVIDEKSHRIYLLRPYGKPARTLVLAPDSDTSSGFYRK